MGWGADRWRLYGLALRESGRRLMTAFRRSTLGPRWRAPRPERLLFAPQDLRTSDPTIAQDLYGGQFDLGGRSVELGGRSPFAVPAPSLAWERALYGFDWLRHMRAADTSLAREHARALVREAIGPRRRQLERGVARQTRVVARRTISFLCQSPLVLGGADHAFYAAFLKAIGRGVMLLERDAVAASRPADRLAAAIALSYASLCCSGLEARMRRATRLLSAELKAQILPDGGHVSRHPGVLVELLLDLLPLRLLYASRNLEVPEALRNAIDRMMPLLRYLRHPSGELALFNGMGASMIDQIATLLSYDDVRGAPPAYAAHSGYGRLEAGGTLLLADVGPAPPLASSNASHAGCLSFELSSGARRIVVNVGTPRTPGPVLEASRRTAGHSTLGLGDESSGLFLRDVPGSPARWLERQVGPAQIAGPVEVLVERGSDPDGWLTLKGRHDGYRPVLGLLHERRWRLSPDGARLDGEDELTGPGYPAAGKPPILRFHLHPSVQVGRENGGAVIGCPGGERWRFRAEPGEIAVEESIYLGGAAGWRPASQIVVRLGPGTRCRWTFERLTRPPTPPTPA